MHPTRRTRISEEIVSTTSDEQPRYQLACVVLGVLGPHHKAQKARWQLETTKRLKGDSWVSIVRTEDQVLMTKSQLDDFVAEYQTDVDNKHIPYYFAIRDTETGKLYAWFNDENQPTPINTPEEKQAAERAARSKGMSEDKVKFLVRDISQKKFAAYPGKK